MSDTNQKTTATMQSLAAAGFGKLDKITPSDEKVQDQLESFRVDVTKQAIKSLRERIPKSILRFNTQVNINAIPGSILMVDDLINSTTETENRPLKKAKTSGDNLYDDMVPSHKQIYNALKELKSDASELIETIGIVKLWIQLNVPRIEDGNNFGVGIQEEAIQELARVEDTAFNLYDAIVKYYMARAKLSTKVLKYPGVEDYKEAVRELDEKEWIHIKITKIDLRNNYCMLYDLLTKNWKKVVTPKNEDTHHRMTF